MTRKIFLAIIFLFAFSFSVWADGVNIIKLDGNFAIVGDNYITLTGGDGDTIINAIGVLPNGGTLKLSGDFSIKKTIAINKPVKI